MTDAGAGARTEKQMQPLSPPCSAAMPLSTEAPPPAARTAAAITADAPIAVGGNQRRRDEGVGILTPPVRCEPLVCLYV
jgi:hypothetical protein